MGGFALSFSQADLDALDAAIASGERTVTIGERTTTYASLADLMQIRGFIAKSLDQTTLPRDPARWRQAVFND